MSNDQAAIFFTINIFPYYNHFCKEPIHLTE